MTALLEIVAIGNELLLGETLDTNTSWIARRLAREGIRVARVSVVGDDRDAIRNAVTEALARTRVVICTGGLGPTSDDLTREVIADLYGRELRLDESWLAELQRRYERRSMVMPQINVVQAMVPEGALMLPNARGTAPGILLDDETRGVTVLLPGVPSEMCALMENQVLPQLRDRFVGARAIESRTLRTTGISEAALAERVAGVLNDIAPLTIAFLPGLPGVDLRFTCWDDVGDAAAGAAFERVLSAVRGQVDSYVYGADEQDLAEVVGDMCRAHSLRLAVAESCTGGLLAKRLTDQAGASEFLLGGIVTYANDAKQSQLNVRAETLSLHGAVSEACAREMALGARAAFSADIGIAITGIAGPGGGLPEKPVGLVWFALSCGEGVAGQLGIEAVTARRFVFPGKRDEVRERAAQYALDMLRRALQRSTS
jgi:nicotinamide-nucleotide amidase